MEEARDWHGNCLTDARFMAKCKLFILEVDEKLWRREFEWELKLGSAPAKAGEIRERLTVPIGKVWLFPLGGDFESIEQKLKGERIVKTIDV